MTSARPHALTAAALAVSASLLLGACGGSPAPAAQASAPAGQGRGTKSSPADPTTPAATPVAATTPAASGGSGKACDLVTRQDANAAVGSDPGAGKPFSSHGSSQCQYGTFQKAFVLVNLNPTRGKAAYDLAHDNPKVGHPVDVSGVGDRAFEITGPNTASIYFDKGDALVVVMVAIQGASSPPKSQVLALAKTAAGRA